MNSDPKKTLLLSQLSLADLLICRISRFAWNPVFFFGGLPRYQRGICKVWHITPVAWASFIGWFLHCEVRPAPAGDKAPNYPYLHLDAMERTSKIAFALSEDLARDPYVRLLARLLGDEAALAYAVKHAAAGIFKQVLALNVCLHGMERRGNLTVYADPSWPTSWSNALLANFHPDLDSFHEWPTGYAVLRKLFSQLRRKMKAMWNVVSAILRQGITGKRKIRRYDLAAEFIDPERLQGGGKDSNFWQLASGEPGSTILYLTHEQRKHLRSIGISLADIRKSVSSAGYEILLLERIPFLFDRIRQLFGLIAKGLFIGRSCTQAGIWSDGLHDIMMFLPLFSASNPEKVLYATLPNGRTSFRGNDGVVTGLCRHFGVQSIGYQTRAIYTTKFVVSFDCFDLYLAWGPGWHAQFPERMSFCRDVQFIGCLYSAVPLTNGKGNNEEGGPKLVSIFPSDMHEKNVAHHYTLGYSSRFIGYCLKLAREYPFITFVLKFKDPGDKDILIRNTQDQGITSLLKLPNVQLGEAIRCRYEQLMQDSDIVMAIGYTTPGTEGLLMGKRVIFYSELETGGHPFAEFPDLIATDYRELRRIFSLAMTDASTYAKKNRHLLDGLDPYRDGKACERARNILFPA